jgi:hypothetical protein
MSNKISNEIRHGSRCLTSSKFLENDKRKEPHPRSAALFMSTDKLFYNYNALRAICQAFLGLLSLWQCNYMPKL